VVAYECLTGAPPFAGTAIEVAVAHRDRSLPPLPAGVPAAVAGFVADLTAKDPAVRPASAAEVAASAAYLRDLLRAEQSPTASFVAPPFPAASYLDAPAATAFLAQPLARRRHGWRTALVLAGSAVAVSLIALIGVNLLGAASAHTGSGAPPVTATRVDVNGQALVGQPVAAAVRELRQQHLRVRVRWVKTHDQPPGSVIAVDPTGRLPVGSLVTVIGAERGHQHDHGHGDGGGGGGGDNGGNGGGGNGQGD
jgi:eukaryotic-like serine/threonine-protein kinase